MSSPPEESIVKKLMSQIEACFGTLSCFDEGKNPLLCPLEPQCANEWMRRHRAEGKVRLK